MATFTNYPTTQPMQLSDMLGDLSTLQQYKQQQQLMPLQLEKAKLELEQSRAKTPTEVLKAGIEGEVANQTNLERKALMEFNKNPENWSTNGRVDLDKLNKAIPLIAPLTGAEHIDKLTKLGEAQTKALESKQNLTQKQREIVSNRFGLLGRLGIQDPQIVRDELQRLKKENPDNRDLHDLIDAYDVPYSMTKPGQHVTQDLVRNSQSMLSSSQQQEALSPKAEVQDVGGQLRQKIVTPSIGGNAPSVQMGGELAGKTLAPQIFANPITGQPQVLGGGSSLQTNQRPQVNMQGAPGTPPPSGVGAGQSNIMPQGIAGGGQLTQMANESPANFNARVANVQNEYTKALSQFNNPNSEYGHIPTIKSINGNILNALKDPSVTTGAISDILAKKTNKGSMNAKEQELSKYLEQRIQNLGPRTDQAAVNLKNAYGAPNLDKEALMNLIRQDNVWVTTQELKTKGILHNGGSQINPNFNAVSAFNQQFSQFAQNPDLMRYVSLVGENAKMKKPDSHDIKEFNMLIGPMNAKQREDLEAERQALVKLVKGQ